MFGGGIRCIKSDRHTMNMYSVNDACSRIHTSKCQIGKTCASNVQLKHIYEYRHYGEYSLRVPHLVNSIQINAAYCAKQHNFVV